jgi:hypothetical protein
MLNILNKNQGALGFLGIISTIITFVFVDNKIYGVSVFILLILITGFYLYFKNKNKKIISLEEARNKAKVLFVDDKECSVITNLQRNNFDVRKVDDIKDTQDSNVIWANLIFVDYKDVGRSLSGKKEGLGLISLLEKTYGVKKRYVIYSSVQDFDGIVKYPYIRKNAGYDEFVSRIISEISQL